MSELSSKSVKAITGNSNHHFFGYYDKSCWDTSQRWVLGQQSTFMDRAPKAGDTITIGVIDTHHENTWRPLARTGAWNWQQGCMLQWLGDSAEIIFNDIGPDGFYSRIININTQAERSLSRPIYAVNRQGTHAVSLNFSRLQNQRPGYGYAGIPDKWEAVPAPTDDGLYSLDLQTGESELILSLAEAAYFQRLPEFEGKLHRFNHIQFSANPERFAFLHRYKTPDEEVGHTRLMTMNLDGSEIRCLSDHGFVSHYDWQGDQAILAWAGRKEIGNRYFLFKDQSGSDIQIIGGERFNCDGHCSFSPNGQFMLTDSYPDETNHRSLLLYHIERDELTSLGRFYAPPMEWQIRCDLHPRWNRDGTQVCIDSIHEGHRQMYVLSIESN